MNKELRASIDIGSNSLLLLVAEVATNQLSEIHKRSEITALGKDLDKNKVFIQESMEATLNALASFVEDCDRYEIDRAKIIVTATEASRVAKNAKEFFDQVEQKLGIRVNIITSDAEAFFSTKGILFNTTFESEVVTIMDIGGASTELIKVNTKTFHILDSVSMPIGSVRSSQWIDEHLFVQNLQKVFLDYRSVLDKFQTKHLYCVAGTVTSLGNMHLQNKEFVEDEVHGLNLTTEDVDVLFKKYSSLAVDDYLELFPFLHKRARSIKGGLHLVYHLIHRLFVKQMIISTYGLRYGTLLEGKISQEHLYGG